MNLGQATETLLGITRESGYSSVASGPNSFRLGRTYRPIWAIAAACATGVFLVGLFFLLVKRTESAQVSIVEERDGVKVRLSGSLSVYLLAALNSHFEHDGVGAQAPIAGTSSGFAPTPASGVGGEPPVQPLPALLLSDGRPSNTIDDADRTVSVAQLRTLRPPTTPLTTGPNRWLRFATGDSVQVGLGVIIGREPQDDPANTGAARMAIDDLSLSRTHLSVNPAPTGVWVVDRHSTNGTSVEIAGTVVPCPPGEGVLVPVGGVVRFGDRSFAVVDG